MPTSLQVLMLEDNPSDAELFLHELRRAGFDPEWQRVETEQEYLAALHPALDIILSDYSLPQFDGLSALRLLRTRGLDLPFILISGTIGEDAAVSAMKEGADDYLLKDRLTRLGPAVKSALEQKRLRDERKRAEEVLRASENMFRVMSTNSPDVIFAQDRELKYIWIINPAAPLSADQVIGKTDWDLLPPEEARHLTELKQKILATGESIRQEVSVSPGGIPRWYDTVYQPLHDETGQVLGVASYARDITERKQAEEALRRSEAQLTEVGSLAKVGGWELDLQTMTPRWSLETYRIHEVDPALQPDLENAINFYASEAQPVITEAVQRAMQEGASYDLELPFITATGRHIWVRTSGQAEFREGKCVRLYGFFQDITERKQAENQLIKINRLYAVISQINQAIVRVRERDVLLMEVCHILIKYGRFRFAWVGLLDEQAHAVVPFAFDGVEAGFLAIKKVSTRDEPEGRGPTGTAIRAGRYVVCHDIADDPRMAPWRDEALQRGYRSSIALPLNVHGTVIGVLDIYASEAHFFDEQEIKLLEEITGDIAFALEVMAQEQERQQAEKLQRAVYRIGEATTQTESMQDLFAAVHGIIRDVMPARNFYIALYDEREDLLSFPYSVDEFDPPEPTRKPGKGLTEYVLRSGQPLLCDPARNEELLRLGEVELIGSPSPIWLGVPLKFGDRVIGVIAVQHYTDGNAYGETEKDMLAYVSLQVTDAIARKQAEEALKASEDKFSSAFRSSPTPITITRIQDGKFLDVNETACRMFGYSREELIGHTSLELGIIDDEARQKNINALKEHGVVRNIESHIITRSGEKRDILLSLETLKMGGEAYVLAILIDITERKRAESEIRKSEERYRSTLDNLMEGCQIIGFDWRYLYVNDNVVSQGRETKEALLGHTMMEVYPGIEKTEMFAVLERCMMERAPQYMENEFTYPDGTQGWFRLAMQPVPEGVLILSADITSRKLAEEERVARETAERANQAKSEFLSRMSHELRTPMNSILGFTQLLKMDELSSDQLGSLEQILKSGQHLLNLINEVLDISRIESGNMPISPEPVQVHEALKSAAELIRPLADQRGIRIFINIPSSQDIFVTADRQRLNQVLLNLLSNAVKYNRENGEINIAVSLLVDGFLHLAVQDTGNGIPPEKMERLFVPFERLEPDLHVVEGTGLGLALSKGLVEAMGGRIGAESVVGEGSTFWLDLQLTTQQKEAIVMAEVDDYLKNSPNLKKGLVLYVEDNFSNIQLIKKILARLPNVELLTAMQGSLALDLVRLHKPGLILLDMHLPDMNGDQVLKQLQAEPETQVIPVIMMSADAMPSQIERMLAAGADAYLTKPIDVKQFLQVVGEMLK